MSVRGPHGHTGVDGTPVPHPNSYRLPGVRLFAGEYPGAASAETARENVRRFLSFGITYFLDLTEEGELEPYAPLLAGEAASLGLTAPVHHRLPIRDARVPTPKQMAAILDAIEAAFHAGHTVYVHCWGGIGRTGTVVGCHLVRGGRTGEEALRELDRLWRGVEKCDRCPRSPETETQHGFVREWRESAPSRHWSPRPGLRRHMRERIRGALVGLAVGDAVGTTVEFMRPGSFPPVIDMVGGGPFRLKPGQWTDDTSMALCLAESLVEQRQVDPRDQMERYVRWFRDGHLSSTGACFDIGGTTRSALNAFERTGEPLAGSTDPHSAGNGSIMRLAPMAMFHASRAEAGIDACGESSRTTHGARTAVDACRFVGALLIGAMNGATKAELLAPNYAPIAGYWSEHPLHPEIDAIAAGSYRTKQPPEIRGGGYVVHSLEAALWAFHNSTSFRDGCLLAVNLGDDADTTAAVYGQIAGAFYGEQGIPAEWREKLALWRTIDEYAERLFELPEAARERWGRGR